MTELLYGKGPILEALRAGRRKIYRFFYREAAQSDTALKEALALAESRKIVASAVPRNWLEEKLPEVLTQGWAAEASEYPYVELATLLPNFKEKQNSIVLALDQIQDPQNLGAILRSAECSGVDAVLVCADRATHVTPAVCKAAAGAEEYLRIAKVTNLARELKNLQKEGFWVVGTSLEAQENALSFEWPAKTVLVLGSEGKGMRRLIHESCDFLIKLPLLGRISSLNVAASTTVFLYEILRFNRQKTPL